METTIERTESAVVAKIEAAAADLRKRDWHLTASQAYVRILSERPELRKALAAARLADRKPPPPDGVARFATETVELIARGMARDNPEMSEAQAYVEVLNQRPVLAGFLRNR